MAERGTRRRFTREDKAQAVKRLLESGKPLSDIATELDVSPGQLSQWRNEQLAAGSAEALAQKRADEAEVLRLRREVKRLEDENLILRKAAAFSPGGSRDQVRLRVRREGEPCCRDAVPGRRRKRQRLLRVAARDPVPTQPRGGGRRVARAHQPDLCGQAAGLWRAPASTLNCAARGAGMRDVGSSG